LKIKGFGRIGIKELNEPIYFGFIFQSSFALHD